MDKRTEFLEKLSAQMVEWEDMKTGAENIWAEVKTMFREGIGKTK